MSLWNLNSERILNIFNANEVDMPLSKAYQVASFIVSVHSERVNEVENNAWDSARLEGDKRVQVAKDRAFEDGKSAGIREANRLASEGLVKLVSRATIWANAEFSYIDLNQKIRCIKHLRQNFPSLELREAKFIVEMLDGSGRGVNW